MSLWSFEVGATVPRGGRGVRSGGGCRCRNGSSPYPEAVKSASIVRVANDKSDRNIPRAVAVAAVAVGLAAVALAVIVTGAAKPQLLLDPDDWCDASTLSLIHI